MKRNIFVITTTIIISISLVIFSFVGCGGGGGGGAPGDDVGDVDGDDTTAPAGYSGSIDQASVNAANETALSFTFAAAEVDAAYNYSIDDTNAGTAAVTGSGTIAAATDQITGINVSSLDDDTLTLTVYLTDTAGNQGSDATDTVVKNSGGGGDTTAPTASAPTNTAQTLKSGDTSTSTVQSDEAGNIFLVLNGEAAATQAEIAAAIAANNAFAGRLAAVAATPYTVTLAANLSDGVYDIVAVDGIGNVSAIVGGWLTVDNTAPVFTSVSDGADGDDSYKAGETITFDIDLGETGLTVTADLRVINSGFSPTQAMTDDLDGTYSFTTLDVDLGTNLVAGPAVAVTFSATDALGNGPTTDNSLTLLLDKTAPTASAPTNTAQTLKSGDTSTSTVQSDDVGNIFLVLNGVPAATQTQINEAIMDNNAFTGKLNAVAATPYTVTLGAGLNNGVYDIVAVDVAGNVSAIVPGWLTVDNTAPTASAPTSTAQTLKSEDESTSTVQSDEAGIIYLILTGEPASTQAEIDTAVGTSKGFIGISGADAVDENTVTLAAGLNDGVYDIVAVDGAGNVSAIVGGWLTVDNTAPRFTNLMPVDGATLVVRNSKLIIIFDEPVVAGAGNVSIWDGIPALIENIAANTAVGLGTSTITITPTLFGDTIPYSVLIDGTAFEDTTGNPFVGIADDITWNFSTSSESDAVPPTASAPISAAQTLKSGDTSTSDVQSNEDGNIYLVRNGVAATSQTEIETAIAANDAFAGKLVAVAATAYTVTLAAGLNDGVYDIVAVDGAGNVSEIVVGWLTVDNTAPTASAPISAAQTLKSGDTSTSDVQSNEDGNIYLVRNGVAATTQTEINAAIAVSNAFTGKLTAVAATPYTVTLGAGLNDGVYDIVAVDGVGNVSAIVDGWLTVDNTAPAGYNVSIDQPSVYTGNETAMSFTFATAEIGAAYDYSVDDTNGGTAAVTGNGSIAGAIDTIAPIDVSSLEDGTLTFTVYLTDPVGNQGENVTDTVTKDTSAPVGYSVNIDQASVNNGNESAVSFTFAAAEVGTNYNYFIDDTNGSTAAIAGNGIIATVVDMIAGIDVSSLSDGTLTLTAYLTNAASNQGVDATGSVVKDTTAPAGYSVNIDQAFVNSGNEEVMSFTFGAAEVGATYNYSIDDTNGGTAAVTGTGAIITATDTISVIDVSSLSDGTLTLTVYLTDTAGYQGGVVTDTVVKKATAPTLITNTPADGATLVLLNTNLSITFSEPVMAGTGYVRIYDAADPAAPAFSINVNGGQVTGFGSTMITVDPSTMSDFNGSSNYYVQIDTTAFNDLYGSSYVGIADTDTWNFGTDTVATDLINPIVAPPLSPVNNSLNISPDSNLVITFDEPVVVGSGNIEILDNNGTPGAGNLGDDVSFEVIDVTSANVTGSGTTTITIDPTGTLGDLTGYYVLIAATAFEDASGNPYAGIIGVDSIWTFTTDDTTAPGVLTLLPSDAIDVVPSADLVITFDESVVVGTGNIIIYDSANTPIQTFNVTTDVTGLPGTSITINPTADLTDLTDYYVQIGAGIVEDAKGNGFAGIADKTTWSFRTADVTPPIPSYLPADEATGVLLNKTLIITFDEPVNVGSGYVTIYDVTAAENHEVIDVTSGQVTGGGTSVIAINSGIIFNGDSNFYVQIDATAFEDKATTPNGFAGITDTTTWNFDTTSPATDLINPIVAPPLSPDNDSLNISPDSNLVITFNEPVVVGSGNIEILDNNGTPGVGNLGDDESFEVIDVTSANVTGSGTTTITIDPTGTLGDLTGYYVLIAATAFEDASGNPYAGIIGVDSIWTFTTDDTTAPSVSTLVAADDAADVLPSANLVITFDELVEEGTGNISIYDSTDTEIETFDVTTDVTGLPGMSLTIDPTADLVDLTDYYVQIDAGIVEDDRGNAFAGIADTTTWNFRTADVTAPTIASLLPADGAVGVFLNRALIITFDETVALGTGNIRIFDASGPTEVEAVDVVVDVAQITGAGTTTLVITPTADFAGSTDYYIQIDATAIDDTATTPNNFDGIADTTRWNFTTTAAATDGTNPRVSALSPANGSPGAALDSNLLITFDEPVVVGTGNIRIFDASGPTEVEAIDVVAEADQISGSGTTTITIDPDGTFDELTDYYVLIAATAFDDTSGNSYDGIVADDNVWAFTSADTTDPAVSTLSPVDGVTGVTSTSNLVITFDESVNVGNGNVRIYNSLDVLHEAVAVTSLGQVTGSGTAAITIDLSKDLTGPKEYYVQIDATAFDDLAGNSFSGISDKATWNFTVVDTTPPSAVSVTPADNATDVALNSMLEMTFDKAVNIGTGNIVIYDASGPTVYDTIDVTNAGQVFGDGTTAITVIPTKNFAGGTDYYVEIAAGSFADTLPNTNVFQGISGSSAWNFTTIGDTTDPGIFSLSPVNGAADVPVSANLVITFDEPVMPGTGNVKIYEVLSSATPAFTIDVTGGDVTGWGTAAISIDPSTVIDLTQNIEYYVNMDLLAFEDTTGNTFAGISANNVWRFTTIDDNAPDGTAPSVYTVVPANGGSNVSTDTNLVIVFDEPVTAGTGNIEIYDLAAPAAPFETVAVGLGRVTGFGTPTITIDPFADLITTNTYYVLIDPDPAPAFKDASGNSFAGYTLNTEWQFTVGADDTLPPTIFSMSPFDGETDVPVSSNLVLTFDEIVIAGTGNIEIYDSADLIEKINAGIAEGYGTKTIVINPVNDFAISTGYYVLIDSGAIRDVSGNDFAGIADQADQVWEFTTSASAAQDSTAPSIRSLTPPNQTQDVAATDTNLMILFDEAVVAGIGDIRIYDSSDALLETINVVPGQTQVSGFGTSTITIDGDPLSPFVASTTYYVEIDAGAFKDLSGNAFGGIMGPATWNFTIDAAAGLDSTVPGLSSLIPVGGGAPLNSNLVLVFDEPVVMGRGDIVVVYDNAPPAAGVVETRISVGSGKVTGFGTSVITIDPVLDPNSQSDNFSNSSLYYVLVDAGAFKDAAGNDFAGLAYASPTRTWGFTVGASTDSTGPDIAVDYATSVTPNDEATDVSTIADFTMTFDQAVVAGTGNIVIWDNKGTIGTPDDTVFETIPASSSRVTGYGTASITIDRLELFGDNLQYSVFIDTDAIKDPAGQNYAGITDDDTWNFQAEIGTLFVSSFGGTGYTVIGDLDSTTPPTYTWTKVDEGVTPVQYFHQDTPSLYSYAGYASTPAGGWATAVNHDNPAEDSRTESSSFTLEAVANAGSIYLAYILDPLVTSQAGDGFGVVFYNGTTRLGGTSYAGANNSKTNCYLDDVVTIPNPASLIYNNDDAVYLLVLKYDFVDSSLSAYLDPDLLAPEPSSPTKTLSSGVWAQVDRIALDQAFRASGTIGVTNYAIDEIKVTRHWELLRE